MTPFVQIPLNTKNLKYKASTDVVTGSVISLFKFSCIKQLLIPSKTKIYAGHRGKQVVHFYGN